MWLYAAKHCCITSIFSLAFLLFIFSISTSISKFISNKLIIVLVLYFQYPLHITSLQVNVQQSTSSILSSSIQNSSSTFIQWNTTWRQQLPHFLTSIQSVYRRGSDLLAILNSTKVNLAHHYIRRCVKRISAYCSGNIAGGDGGGTCPSQNTYQRGARIWKGY